MSKLIDGKPISMWTNEKLTEALDRIVCCGGHEDSVIIIAEAVARLCVTGLPTAPPVTNN
jgi:hypothetical protein